MGVNPSGTAKKESGNDTAITEMKNARNGLSAAIALKLSKTITGTNITMLPKQKTAKVGPSSITLGIILGIFLIALCIIATGLYTFLANTYFDKDQNEVLEQLEKNGVLEALKSGEIHYKEQAAETEKEEK